MSFINFSDQGGIYVKKLTTLVTIFIVLLSLPLMAQDAKAVEDIRIVEDVPVSEKGYTFDPADPYAPPVSGFAEHMEASGCVYSVYVPQDMQPWSPGVIILVPDGVSSRDFALSETGRQWMHEADEESFALGFVEASSDGWNTTGDPAKRDDLAAVEAVYTQMRSKSQTLELPFTMDKSRVSLVGYEEGGAMALAVAAGSSASFCGVVAINQEGADISYIEKLGSSFCFPFPGDGMNYKEEVGLVSGTLAMPVWFINSYDEAVYDYYRDINHTDSWSQNRWASVAYNSANTVEAVWRSEGTEPSPEIIWDSFVSTHTRPLGVEGGHLAYAMDFDQREDGRGYIYTEETFDGLIRRYMTYVPESYDESTPAPMVLVLHGYTATMYALAEESRWCDLAEEYGIIVVFAQGYPNPDANPANIPAPSWMAPALFGDAQGADDIAFLTHVIEETKAKYNIDETRVYGTGHSNGCAMTLALASSDPDLFTAIAPIGYAAEGLVDSFADGVVMPLSLYYGQYDSAVNEDGVKLATAYWTAINGLENAETETRTSDDGRFTTVSYISESGAPLVEFTEVANSAHSYFPAESWRIWTEFFSHYTKENGTVYYDGIAVN